MVQMQKENTLFWMLRGEKSPKSLFPCDRTTQSGQNGTLYSGLGLKVKTHRADMTDRVIEQCQKGLPGQQAVVSGVFIILELDHI